ncbi:MAG: HIT domain-containing protein [Holosporales bacterium]|jgi:histidine triad (HIT) family protein|nr:HIT domain-containing protein [Holosporales bacterium]
MEYDKNNVFYKIINKTLKADIVLEGKHFLAFHDIAPRAPVHILIIPKGYYVDYCDFVENASNAEILDLQKGIAQIVEIMKLKEGGYKLLSNAGKFKTQFLPEAQEVMHMHVHILGKSSEE